MNVEREITLDAPPEEVWEALTDPEQLEEWFANDVEFDLERGGTSSAGTTARPPRGRRGGRRGAAPRDPLVGSRRRGGERGHLHPRRDPGRNEIIVRETALVRLGWGIQAVREDAVFSALSDPSRRYLVESLADRGVCPRPNSPPSSR